MKDHEGIEVKRYSHQPSVWSWVVREEIQRKVLDFSLGQMGLQVKKTERKTKNKTKQDQAGVCECVRQCV